jgi:hypothetical protein
MEGLISPDSNTHPLPRLLRLPTTGQPAAWVQHPSMINYTTMSVRQQNMGFGAEKSPPLGERFA